MCDFCPYHDTTPDELACCALFDPKHQEGVQYKNTWIAEQLKNNYIFYKLDDYGQVFIEYTDAENAWATLDADGYLFIHCLWVPEGDEPKKNYAQLVDYAVHDARLRGKHGLTSFASAKRIPYLREKDRLLPLGFAVTDKIDDYELLSLTLDDAPPPKFPDTARLNKIDDTTNYVVYFSPQCPYLFTCVKEMIQVAREHNVPLKTIEVKSRSQARGMHCVFNNFAVFRNGVFLTHRFFNRALFEKEVLSHRKG